MTAPWRLAALALALCACGPRTTEIAETPDAAPPPPPDGGVDGAAAPCVPGGTSANAPTVIACAQGTPTRLALDGVNLYWTVQARGAIVMKAPLAGGPPAVLVYDDAAAVGLAVDATFVYYTQPTRSRVMRVPIAGGPEREVAAGLEAPTFLALGDASDGPSLYWTGGQTMGRGTITKLTLTEGAKPAILIDGQSKPRALAIADGFIYWTDFADGTVLRAVADLDETASAAARVATRLAADLKGPSDLALAGGFVYVPDQAGRIARVPMAGGALETVARVDGVPFGVVADARAVYWSTAGAGGIFKAPLGANVTPTTIFAPEADARFLALSANNIYWGAWGGGGAVRRMAR